MELEQSAAVASSSPKAMLFRVNVVNSPLSTLTVPMVKSLLKPSENLSSERILVKKGMKGEVSIRLGFSKIALPIPSGYSIQMSSVRIC